MLFVAVPVESVQSQNPPENYREEIVKVKNPVRCAGKRLCHLDIEFAVYAVQAL